MCRAPPRPTANVHGDYQQWIIGGGVALTEGGLGSLLCIRRFVHELWIQIAGPYLCMSLNGQRLPNNLLIVLSPTPPAKADPPTFCNSRLFVSKPAPPTTAPEIVEIRN